MATRETAAADSNVSGQRRCNRAMAMALWGRDGETWVASKQIQRGCKRAMETRATAIKAGQRRHKWAMVQATATVMYCKGSSFYNSIINKDGPRMLARWWDNNERQIKLPPSSNTVSLQRILFLSEIRSPWSVTPFFCQNAPFPPKSNKTAPAAKPLLACSIQRNFRSYWWKIIHQCVCKHRCLAWWCLHLRLCIIGVSQESLLVTNSLNQLWEGCITAFSCDFSK